MRMLIGGSGSTGSSLLKNILSRHPAIFAGSETSLFTKRELFVNFSKHKWRILKSFPFGLKSHSFHMYNGVDLMHHEYAHNIHSIKKIISETTEFQQFADLYFNKGMKVYDKCYWLEKTPANSCCFRYFLDTFNDSKVILMVRDPLESIASMINRGFSTIYACGVYMINNAAAVSLVNDNRFCILSYEDLTTNPIKTVKTLCKQLDIRFYPEMLDSGNNYNIRDTRIDSWEYDEIGVVQKKTKNNFKGLPDKIKEEVLCAILYLKFSKSGKNMFDIELNTLLELLELLNYKIDVKLKDFKALTSIKKQMSIDKRNRMLKLYHTGFHYPLAL